MNKFQKVGVTVSLLLAVISYTNKEMDVFPPVMADDPPVIERAAEQPSRGARRVIKDVEVTWYNDQGKTFSGRVVTEGVTCAVDTRVIPLNSWIKITMPDGAEYIRRADDTGSAVKGKVVDIHSNASTRVLLREGRTYGCTVEILELGDGKAEWE